MKQPEALRLADALDERRVTRWVHATGETPRSSGYAVDAECAQAAAELRRLHAVNAEMLGALRGAVEALDRLTDLVDGTGFSDADDFNRALDEIDLGRAAIAKAGEQA